MEGPFSTINRVAKVLRLRFSRTEIGLDSISVGIDHECSVVIRSVFWPQTRPAIIAAAGAQCGCMKRVDGCGARCGKTDMEAGLFVRRNRMLGEEHPECDGFGSIPVAGGCPGCSYAPLSERLQSGVVEALAFADVAYPDRDMSNHSEARLVRDRRATSPPLRCRTCAEYARDCCAAGFQSGLCQLWVGLDVEFLAGKGGVNSATQVGVGNADVAAVLGETVIIVRSQGVPVRGRRIDGRERATIIPTREEAGITRVEDLRGKSISTIGFTRPKGRRCGHLPPCCARAVEKTLDAVQNELVLVRPLQRRPDLTQVSRIANRALRRGCGQYFQFGPN